MSDARQAIIDGLGGAQAGASAAAVVADRLLTLFMSGDIAHGTRLPSERDLAAQLQVGRSAIREALAALEILGVVEIRPGSGTYLRGAVSELLPQTLRWGILIGDQRLEELIEIRGGLEITAAQLAADRARPADVKRLEASVSAMRDSLGDMKKFVEADLRFHHDLSRAAGNDTLGELLQVVRSLLRVWVDRAVQDPQDARRAVEEHALVLEAVKSGDPSTAVQAMTSHMSTASTRLRALAEEDEARKIG